MEIYRLYRDYANIVEICKYIYLQESVDFLFKLLFSANSDH